MIKGLRRTATAVAALALIGGASAGIAGASTPGESMPAQTAVTSSVHTWFDPVCEWGEGFDWRYYYYCDHNFWHGSHYGDWQRFDHDHRGYDYGWHH